MKEKIAQFLTLPLWQLPLKCSNTSSSSGLYLEERGEKMADPEGKLKGSNCLFISKKTDENSSVRYEENIPISNLVFFLCGLEFGNNIYFIVGWVLVFFFFTLNSREKL